MKCCDAMGLTIHYKLKLRPDSHGIDDLRARWAVEEAREIAKKFKRRGRFDAVSKMSDDRRMLLSEAMAFVKYRHPKHGEQWSDVPPLRGWVFVADVGADCEPLRIGLCEYPASFWDIDDDHASKLRGWQLKAFSKTQYASLNGWEHFRRCHVAVVDFLAALHALGIVVKISDEGHYWPHRDVRTLRANVEMMNRVVASAAGALKDAFGDGGVQSPIFAHPQFERLEAEGVAERPDVADAARRIAGKLPRAQ